MNSDRNHLLLRALSDHASERLPELLAALAPDLRDGGRDWCGPCPVHGGDNATALKIYADGHTRRGNWVCNTHHCEEAFGRDAAGFARGVLSHREHGWTRRGDTVVSVPEVIFYLADLYDVDPAKLLEPGRERERAAEVNSWAARVNRLTPRVLEQKRGWSRDAVRASLRIPSPYFLGRGFPAGVLDSYDVGEPRSTRPGSPMAGRAVVPVYDLAGDRCVGFTGRATAEGVRPKWHNEGFASGTTLFNIWRAKGRIRETKKVILVEGPGDCLKLVAAGVENVVACFGTSVTETQIIILESLGTMQIVPLFDFDDAGRLAVQALRRQAGRAFRVFVPDWEPSGGKDVGGETPSSLSHLARLIA